MIKNNTTLFLIFALALVIVPAGAVANNNSYISCNTVQINDLKISEPSGITPVKIGFIGTVTGPVERVVYTVIDSQTGESVCSSSSFCSQCVGRGLCICSCEISKPGTYDVQMVAYGPEGCCVTLLERSAITLTDQVAETQIITPPISVVKPSISVNNTKPYEEIPNGNNVCECTKNE